MFPPALYRFLNIILAFGVFHQTVNKAVNLALYCLIRDRDLLAHWFKYSLKAFKSTSVAKLSL